MLGNYKKMICSIFIFIVFAIESVCPLKWTRFNVPEWVKVGNDTTLICQFDLEGELLYSVKWYKAEREIYRYVPAEYPRQMAFDMPGVSIDERDSNDQQLILKKVNFSSSGRYKCEVLTDGPYFKTLVKSAILQVVDLPKESPILQGKKDEYQLGELINITCLTAPSLPQAQLTWYINDRPAKIQELAPPSYYQYGPMDTTHPMSSSLRLEILAQKNYFIHGMITLLCQAKIDGFHESRVLHTAREISGLRPSLLEGYTGAACGVVANGNLIIKSLSLAFFFHLINTMGM